MRLLCDISALCAIALAATFLIMACAGALTITATGRRGRLSGRIHGCGSDPICEEGVSVIASGFSGLDQIERRLSLDYGRFEVIVLADSSCDAGFGELLAKYSMTQMNEVPLDELPCGRCRGLYRSRQRRYRRLVVIDRERTTLCDDFNCGVAAAAFEWIVALDKECELDTRALQHLIIGALGGCERMSAVAAFREPGSGSFTDITGLVTLGAGAGAVFGANWYGGTTALFDREEAIAAGGYRDDRTPDAELLSRIRPGRRDFLPQILASSTGRNGCAGCFAHGACAAALRAAQTAAVMQWVMLTASAIRGDGYGFQVMALSIASCYTALTAAAAVSAAAFRMTGRREEEPHEGRFPLWRIAAYPFFAVGALISWKNFGNS